MCLRTTDTNVPVLALTWQITDRQDWFCQGFSTNNRFDLAASFVEGLAFDSLIS